MMESNDWNKILITRSLQRWISLCIKQTQFNLFCIIEDNQNEVSVVKWHRAEVCTLFRHEDKEVRNGVGVSVFFSIYTCISNASEWPETLTSLRAYLMSLHNHVHVWRWAQKVVFPLWWVWVHQVNSEVNTDHMCNQICKTVPTRYDYIDYKDFITYTTIGLVCFIDEATCAVDLWFSLWEINIF